MSKFFNETQKARQWAARDADPLRLDVVSVMDAIRQDEGMATNLAQTSPPPKVLQVHMEPRISELITGVKGGSHTADAAMEAYRTLRTRVMRLQASKGIRSIMLTSAVPSEGKTVTALNLALSCAQLREPRILLVDGDLRSRGLTRLLEIHSGPGLSGVLSGSEAIGEGVLPTEHDNLFVVGAGLSSAQPAELFASRRWSEFISWANQSFSIVIVDGPPIHMFTDAELIGAGCDGALLVIRAFSTPREIAQKCANRLDRKKLIGIVFNGLPSGPDSYSYYGASNANSDGNSNEGGSR